MAGDGLLAEALAAIEDANPASLVAIVGPTASGKTALAVALAEALGGEVVSADSVQIYDRFDIGSGKPSSDELARARHHLVGTVDPREPFDAARYAEAAEGRIADIVSRGKRPILCGGTFLWVKALIFGLAHAPAASPEIRQRHRLESANEGQGALHARLRQVDPELAARLHPNDLVRVSRGLEVFELTGRPLSSWQGEHGFRSARRPSILFAIQRSAETLTERIERRVSAWLDAGWIAEVEGLLGDGYGDARAMRSVGYREVADHVLGKLARDELPRAIVRSTRVFARRQRTWLNHGDVRWLAPP